jgi:uncharacterized protein (DUF2461 family)
VKQPSQEFVMAMGDKLKAIAPKIHAIPKVNQSLFRLNRDTRFSKDKSPYKTNLGIWFWEGDRKRMECHDSAKTKVPTRRIWASGSGKVIERGWNALVSISIWIQITLCWAPAYTSRDAVVDKKHGLELQKAVNKVSKLGYTIVGKHYKRIPSGYDDTHKNSQFLLYNGLAAMHQNEISEGLLSDRIVDYAFSHFKKMSPIHKGRIGLKGDSRWRGFLA